MPTLQRRVAVALLAAVAACASGARAAGTDGSLSTHVTRVRMRSTGNHPELVIPRGGTGEFRVDITVMVDPDGQPDMTTLRIMGNALSENRDALSSWIARSVFEPAKADGVPVRAEYRTDVRAKIVVRSR